VEKTSGGTVGIVVTLAMVALWAFQQLVLGQG
jgi:hypothetical protein